MKKIILLTMLVLPFVLGLASGSHGQTTASTVLKFERDPVFPTTLGDYVSLPPSILQPQGALTISAWVKPSTVRPGTILCWSVSTTVFFCFGFDTGGAYLLERTFTGANLLATPVPIALPSCAWTQVAVTVADGAFGQPRLTKFYYNGLLVHTTTFRRQINNFFYTVLTIGANRRFGTIQTAVDGLMQEVQLFNSELSPAVVPSLMLGSAPTDARWANLLGYWKMDDGSGQVARDSRFTNNGILGASLAPATDDPTWATPGDSAGVGCAVVDADNDTIPDASDNCPQNANPGQEDADDDGLGDACDPDDDDDGILDGDDNCALASNGGQQNNDLDGLGDVCDPDDDNDGIDDETDNCALVANENQLDTDEDGAGDACDLDDDNDGVLDSGDNCPVTANPGQADLDGDAAGDACDADLDGDGAANETDNCPTVSNADQANQDGDATGDVCDPDIDGDGVTNAADNCPVNVNAGQEDNELDGLGDLCDLDDDNDGAADVTDNCPVTANPTQADFDGDADDDGDGVADAGDTCPSTPLGLVVDPGTGCSLAQLCPCAGPRGQSVPWRNHGQYVSCVAHSANALVQQGLMSSTQHGATVSAAAQSSCGNKR